MDSIANLLAGGVPQVTRPETPPLRLVSQPTKSASPGSAPNSMLDRMGLRGLEQKTLASFDASLQPEAFAAASGFLADPTSLVLSGPPGTGKSHLLGAIANEVILKYGVLPVRVCLVRFPEILRKIRATFQEQYEGPSEEFWLQRWQRIPLLLWDDVGTEGGEKASDFTRSIAFEIIDARYRRGGKPIVVATNKGPREIGEWISEAGTSRLMEMGQWLQMRPGDQRLVRR
jgi:DNA replication protein DnaC